MDIEKFLILYEEVERMTNDEKVWLISHLNKIIERYNEKYNKHIDVRF